MLNFKKDGLSIFDNIQIDFNLPKWKHRIAMSKDKFGSDPTKPNLPLLRQRSNPDSTRFLDIAAFINPTPSPGGVGFIVGGTQAIGCAVASASPATTKESIANFFKKIFNRKKLKSLKREMQEAMEKPNFVPVDYDSMNAPAREPGSVTWEEFMKPQPVVAEEDKISTTTFFSCVKNSAEEIVLANERFQHYEKVLEHLKDSGQEALYENMCMDFEIHYAETQLYATGFRKMVTEKNVIEFAAKAPRAIKIDWVKNFTRSIPAKIVEQKKKLDGLFIFDNYVVMHYDPYQTGSEKTAKEKEEEKDPILFGIIAGKQNLYYIGDWTDEYCDLAFEKMVEQLGAEAINANDLTAHIKVEECK